MESSLQRSRILHMIALEKCFPLPGCQGGSFVFKPNEAYLSYLISFSFDIYIYIYKIGALLFPNADFLKSYQIKIDRGVECARPAHIPGACACVGNG